jgi:hypothetical protein
MIATPADSTILTMFSMAWVNSTMDLRSDRVEPIPTEPLTTSS